MRRHERHGLRRTILLTWEGPWCLVLNAGNTMCDLPTNTRVGRWTNHGTLRTVYSSWWLSLTIDKVEKPDGTVVEHEVVRGPDAAGMVILNEDRGVLMMWRHRFMPDSWGWEVPGGVVDPGENAETAARRECLEETGWEAIGPVTHISRHHPSCGLVSQTFDLYLATDAEFVGPPTDKNEAASVAWRPVSEVASDMHAGFVPDGLTQLAVAIAFARTGNGDLLGTSRLA